MKKILTSFGLSLPVLALGVVSISQATNPSFLASADSTVDYTKTGSILLMVVGLVLIALAALSIIFRFIKKKG